MSLPKPYYYDGKGIVIYNADCRDILPHLPKVDLVLTDPPYGILQNGSAVTRRFNKNKDRGVIKWDIAPSSEMINEIILKNGEKSMIWGGNNFNLGVTYGWLVWDKQNDNLNFGECEYCWTNMKFAPRIHRERCVNIDNERIHPTQKPIKLMKFCIQQADYWNIPQNILDPFMGSGTTLRAAKDLGRKCIGIEIEEKYCEIAVKRLQQEVFDFK